MLLHPTFLTALLNIMILVSLVLIGWITNNPLTIMGLLLLQSIPVLPAKFTMEDIEGFQGQESRHADLVAESKIGFTANIK